MGSGQSKADQDEQDELNEVPVQFSQDVVNHLADAAGAPGPSPNRQKSIDAQIRSHIHSEVLKLQQEEQEVLREIEVSLEKENLNHHGLGDTPDDASDEDARKSLNSIALLGDLEEVRHRVDKFRSKQEDLAGHPAVQSAQALASCYANNATRSLECYKEVVAFKSSVAQLEQDYVASFR